MNKINVTVLCYKSVQKLDHAVLEQQTLVFLRNLLLSPNTWETPMEVTGNLSE